MQRPLIAPADSYDACVRGFRWPPEAHSAAFNIAHAVCERHAAVRPDATALILDDGSDAPRTVSFIELERLAGRLANVLSGLGVVRGDRVAIQLPQSLETAVAHVAIYKLGAIALPLASLFGPDALAHRLADSEARVLITNRDNLTRLAPVREGLPALSHVLSCDGPDDGAHDLYALLAKASDRFDSVATSAEDPALLVYTSGTTGPPKGALHAHRVLIGHMPGIEMPHRFFPQPGDRQWTPADWAWVGGLLDVLLPGLFHGVPVVATRPGRFDPESTFDLMARCGVRNTFLPPTALRMLRQVENPHRYALDLRSVASGGESLGEAMIAWGKDVFGLTINEFYGQTECNVVVASNADLYPVRPGAMGKPVPGHMVAVVSEDGDVLPANTEGIIAVRCPDPVMFLEYWRQPDATRAKFASEWCLLGDLGWMDDDGYFWFKSRADDVIISAGYRIGPTEVEECLLKHPAVAHAGVIGAPDATRGEIVKAYVVPSEGVTGDDALAAELQHFVRERLAAHEYPRAIRFIDEMPLTVTGKIRRVALREMSASDHAPSA